MNKVQKFDVFSRGEIDQGFELKDVISSFAALFQIPEEEAAEYVTTKKLIGNQLSNVAAAVYIDKISAVGLLTFVIDKDSANDKKFAEYQKSPERAVREKKFLQSSVQEPSRLHVNCPKCHKLQQKSAICSQCSLVFSSYLDSEYKTKKDPERFAFKDEKNARNKRILTRKPLALFALVVSMGLLSLKTIGSVSTSSYSRAEQEIFVQQNTAGEKVNQLIEIAGLSASFSEIDKEIEMLFRDQLSLEVKERGGRSESVTYITNNISMAYNQHAGLTGLANWLQMTLNESEIDSLLELHDTVLIRKFSDDISVKQHDSEIHKIFIANYEENPIQPERRRALEKLVDIMSFDSIGTMIFAEGRIALIRVAASTAPDFNSDEGRYKTRSKIQDIKQSLPDVRPYIREEMIKNLARHVSHYTVADLQNTARALDKPEIREMYKQIGRGTKNYLSDAAAWLVVKSGQHAASVRKDSAVKQY